MFQERRFVNMHEDLSVWAYILVLYKYGGMENALFGVSMGIMKDNETIQKQTIE